LLANTSLLLAQTAPPFLTNSCYGSTRIDAIGLWVIDYGCGSAVKIDEISGEDGGFKIYGEGLGIGECGGKEQDG